MTDDINDVSHTSTYAKAEEAIRKDERSRSSPGIASLLPCPFCGKQPRSEWCGVTQGMPEDGGYWAVECCSVHVHEDDEQDAVRVWNARPARSSAESTKPWVEGEPSECDGSAWDRLPPLVVASREIAWLIEWPEDDINTVRWWNPAHGWMRDANKALHFSRKTDADCYLSTMRFGLSLKVTEHVFIGDEPRDVALAQAAPEYILPCDVHLEPATIIRAGCKLSTLLSAIKLREGEDWKKFASMALPSTQGEIKPHLYSPDYQAMGDCRVCGHDRDKPWHSMTSPDRGSAT